MATARLVFEDTYNGTIQVSVEVEKQEEEESKATDMCLAFYAEILRALVEGDDGDKEAT